MACRVFVFHNLAYNRRKRKGVQCPHLCFFFRTLTTSRGRKGAQCPPLCIFFATLDVVRRGVQTQGGRNGPYVFFFTTLATSRGRGGKPCPPLGLFQNIGYNMKNRGAQCPPCIYFVTIATIRQRRGSNQRKRVEKLSLDYKS
jgi:hypothetical protein